VTPDEDVITLDRYLDDLLAGDTRPAPLGADIQPDPELEHAARAVSFALARFHPSFRFEERLAARLRAAATMSTTPTGVPRSMAPGDEPPRLGVVIPFAPRGVRRRSRSRRVNGALIGGAISAGVSLASIAAGALVARRRGRGDGRWERVI
jgi:hypothetical protein